MKNGCVNNADIPEIGKLHREYRPLERIRDNYPKYVATTDFILQQRNGIRHINLIDFMKEGKAF